MKINTTTTCYVTLCYFKKSQPISTYYFSLFENFPYSMQ